MTGNWQTLRMVCCALAASVLLAACGVKSPPAQPDGATYPRSYPEVRDAPTAGQQNPAANRRGSTYVLPRSRSQDGLYEPPPPATQLPAQ